MANIGDRGIKTLEDAENYIAEKYLPCYNELGYGSYVCISKATAEVIGTCGLYKRPDLDHPDIGFALLPEFAKQGYAYEAAQAVKEYAKKTLMFDTLFGITLPTNTNSIRLLEKLGFKNTDRIHIEGDSEELLLFSASL